MGARYDKNAPHYFERGDLPNRVKAINAIRRQPYFGRTPANLRYATWFQPSYFWLYGTALEQDRMRSHEYSRWEDLLSASDLTPAEKVVAMYGAL